MAAASAMVARRRIEKAGVANDVRQAAGAEGGRWSRPPQHRVEVCPCALLMEWTPPGRNRGNIALLIMAMWERQMTEITSVVLDIAKNWFQVHAANAEGSQ